MPIANINNLTAGSAIRIQDLVRTLNSGAGLKICSIKKYFV